jgi:hypothetical protein
MFHIFLDISRRNRIDGLFHGFSGYHVILLFGFDVLFLILERREMFRHCGIHGRHNHP